MLAKNKDDMKAKVQEEVTAQFAAFMQNYGKTAIFANAGAVLPNVHPIESAPPTMPFLQVLGFHSGGANLPESEPSPALADRRGQFHKSPVGAPRRSYCM